MHPEIPALTLAGSRALVLAVGAILAVSLEIGSLAGGERAAARASAPTPPTRTLAPAEALRTISDIAPDVRCGDRAGSAAIAEELMQDRYRLDPHPAVDLPHDLTWAEDPLQDRNWQFQFQSLDFLLALLQRSRHTGLGEYRARAMEIARSWTESADRAQPPSPFTWYEHSVALRAQVLVCLAGSGATPDWLLAALRSHGRLLADEAFIAPAGNHRLDDALGLLMVGCRLDRPGWVRAAARRLDQVWPTLVDAQGASTEGSTWYAAHAYQRGAAAVAALRDCHQPVGSAFRRRALMPRFLALATDPDGRYTMIGDTLHLPALPFRGTEAVYPATLGARGSVPAVRAAVYRAGYLFSRTGWGVSRPILDERAMSLRFGASGFSHAHDDAGSVTLFGYRSRLLVDAGMWGYQPADPERRWAVSRAAHNVVTIDGKTPRRGARPRLIRARLDRRLTEALVDLPIYAGVSLRRHVLFSTRLGYMVVEDVIRSSRPVTARQLWHLMPGSRPTTRGRRTWTRGDRGDVLVLQLREQGTSRVVEGARSPMQGWLGDAYRVFEPAPVLSQRARGTTIRFITLVVPFRSGRPPVSVRRLAIGAHGFSMMVRVGSHRELVRSSASGASISSP